MREPPARGLPPRIYLPILAVVAILFLSAMFYLLSVGFRVTGAAFGTSVATPIPSQGPRSTK
ncbi:MAG TPA: hypothetical protein VMD07_00535 [Candidatus Acidoferrales bacterium]|nr:hypothetical protein [Candidatus Acidoferrales bacterium]